MQKRYEATIEPFGADTQDEGDDAVPAPDRRQPPGFIRLPRSFSASSAS
jgi:hypothetical protein